MDAVQRKRFAGVIRLRTLLAEGGALAMVIDGAPFVSLESLLGAEPPPLSTCVQTTAAARMVGGMTNAVCASDSLAHHVGARVSA